MNIDTVKTEIKEAESSGKALADRIELLSKHSETVGTIKEPKWERDKWWKKRYQVCPECMGTLDFKYIGYLFGTVLYARCEGCEYEWASKYRPHPQD